MQRLAFALQIVPGAEEEYRRRHRHIWPELVHDMRTGGCLRFAIFAKGRDLFAYMEVEDFTRYLEAMRVSAANARWQEYMQSIVLVENDPTFAFPLTLEEVFVLDTSS